jgi:hypothetical protein
MKFVEKSQKISEKSQRRIDRIGIILGLSLLIACGFSYFVLDAFGQQDFEIDCPKNSYHGLDSQGNEACRDILTNQIIEPESRMILDSDSEKMESDYKVIIVPETGKIILNNEQTPIVEISILVLIGIGVSVIGISVKKRKLKIFQRKSWSGIKKEQVRNRQYGKCNMCFTSPSKWKYDYFDGNKDNDDLYNCQGLCSDCYSVKTKRDNRISIYQKSN